jgi:hypothetical protein
MSTREPASTTNADRRRFLKLAAIGIAAAPFAGSLIAREAHAADPPMVDPATDPIAKSLNYACEGAKATGHRAGEFCKNCQLYTANPDGKTGACQLFVGKRVCADGWCSSYTKKVA